MARPAIILGAKVCFSTPYSRGRHLLTILLKLFETFTAEIAKKFADKAIGSKPDVCRELIRLFVVLEELLHAATKAYQVFEHYVDNFDSYKDDFEYKRTMRQEGRELLGCLKRFETYLKKVFVKLELLDESNLSIRLVEVPESSYSLFKKHFVEDLAPRFIADRSGGKYMLRLARGKNDYSLVSTNNLGHLSLDLDRLFKEGALVYEVIDFNDQQRVSQVLSDCSTDLLKLKAVTESLKVLIRKNCDLKNIL